jgi:hypothetical protein
MSQLSYSANMAIAVAGLLGDIGDSFVRSYINGNSIKKRYTFTVSAAADVAYALSLTSPLGVVTAISFDEGAAGTLTSKRDGLIAAINASDAKLYCFAYAKDADEFYVEARLAGQDFTAAEADANLTLVNDTAFVAQPIVGFGLALAQGTQDPECRLLAANTDKVIGVSVFSHADNINNGVEGYAAQSAVNVLRRGTIWVKVEEAVAAEDPVYVRAVAVSPEVAGAFRKTADGADTIALSGCKFLSSAAAGGLALVDINI